MKIYPVTKQSQIITETSASSITNQLISALTVWSYSMSLNRSDYTHGHLMLGVPNTISNLNTRRTTALIFFTTKDTDAAAQTSGRVTTTLTGYNGILYNIVDWRHQGFFRSVDNRLSDTSYTASGSGNVRLSDCYISGSYIILSLYNSHITFNAWISMNLQYKVWKVKH